LKILNTPTNAYEKKLSSGLVATLLVLSSLTLVPIFISPAHAANAQFTTLFYYPYASVGSTGDVRSLKITNPLGNIGITEVDLNLPSASASAVSAGAFVSGFVSTGTVVVAGTGPWTIVYPGSSSSAVILPGGAAGKIDFTFNAESAESTAGVADNYGLTLTVHYTDGSTQSSVITLYEGRLTGVTVATTVSGGLTTATAGTAFSYTATQSTFVSGSFDSGIALSFSSSPATADVVADGFSASFGTPSFTTTSTTTVSSTFVTTEASLTAVADAVTCTDVSCFYFATANAGTFPSPNANGQITATFSGTHVNVVSAAPTQVKVNLPGTSGGWDLAGHALDYISTVGPATLGLTLADSYGNAVTSSAASGTATFSVLQGTLSATSGTVTSGGLTTLITYSPLKPSCTSNCLLQYGTFDLISASLVITTGSLAGTYAGSSKQMSMGFAYTSAAIPVPTIFRYTTFVTDTTGASGSGNAVAGSKVNLAVTLTGGSGAQKNVPVNFTLTSTSLTTPYTGTFANGKSWIVVVTSSLGIATANFTADTTSGDAATALAIVNEPTSYPTYSASNTGSSLSTGAVTTIAAAGTKLKISTYSDSGLTTSNTYVKPGGKLYLNIRLQDQYGNTVPWTNSFALLQINLAASAGSFSSTTVYINSGKSSTSDSLYAVQYIAPSTLGDQTISATTPYSAVSGTSKTVHVVSINPGVSLTPPAKTTLTVNTVSVNATGIPSKAASTGTVVVTFKYSLNGAANVTAGITSTNSSGASFTSFSVTFTSGSNTLKIYATDSNGNVGAATFAFTVTAVVPTGFATSQSITGAAKATIGGFTGVSATVANGWTASESEIMFAVFKNSAGQTVAVATGGLTLASGASSTAFAPLLAPLPTGTYTVSVFIVTTGNLPDSATTTITVSF